MCLDHLLQKVTKKETKIAKVCRKMLFLLLAVFPFGIILVEIWPNVTQKVWATQRLPAFLITGTLIFCAFIVKAVVSKYKTKTKIMLLCLFLFFTACSLRIFILSLLQTEPVSDFYTCYHYAVTGNGKTNYLARYSYLGAYALTLRIFFKIVEPSVWNAQMLNVCITSCIPVVIFFTAKRITKKNGIGAAAGFAYAVCPSVVIYTAVPSCEHFSQFFMALAVGSFACYCTLDRENKKKWVFSLTTGLLFGCVCIYKRLFIIIAPSLLMACLLYECIPILLHADWRSVKKKIAVIAAQNCLIIFTALIVLKTGESVVQKVLDEQNLIQDTYSAAIYKGLCKEGNGVWNFDINQYINKVLREYDDPKEIDRLFYGKLVEEYKDNIPALLAVIQNKFFIDWCSEDYYYWTFSGEGNLIQGSWIGEVLFVILPRVFLWYLSLTIVAGLLLRVIKDGAQEEMQFLFFLTGMVFLFACALLLIEAQGRYKSSLMPIICVLFGFCADYVQKGLWVFCKRICFDRKIKSGKT